MKRIDWTKARRRAVIASGVLFGLWSLYAIFEAATHEPLRCEKCGSEMRPFKKGTDREDSDILECSTPGCGFMLNTRHTQKF